MASPRHPSRILLVLAFLGAAGPLVPAAQAQPGLVLISGTVVDADGAGLPGVQIEVMETGLVVTTNAKGHFRLPLPPGTYRIVASMAGFSTQVRETVTAVSSPQRSLPPSPR